MPIPTNLLATSYDTCFNGDVAQQCANGTYGECRHLLVRQLDRDVELKNITQEDADKKLDASDALWIEAQKNPEVKEKMKAREQMKDDHAAAIVKAAESELAELRGFPVDLEVAKAKEPSKKKK